MAPATVSDESMEKLFELVRKNACIYNPRDPFHKDAKKLNNIWTSIHRIMKSECPDMTGK